MKKITALLLAVILLASLAACGGDSGSSSGGSSAHNYAAVRNPFIFDTSYGSYALNVNLADTDHEIDLSDTDYSAFLMPEDKDKTYYFLMTQIGDDFYGHDSYSGSYDLYHVTAVDRSTVTKEIWVSEEQLKESCLADNDDPIEYEYARSLENLMADGSDIYAVFDPYHRFAAKYKMSTPLPAWNRIVRIGKSGDSIAFVGGEEVRATAFVIRDGWIYYADNGFAVSGGEVSYDDARAGIYKMKTDGSERTLLCAASNVDCTEEGKMLRYSAANLSLYDDQLYFIDLSADCRLCRIGTDGSGYEKISSGSVHTYIMDPDANCVYCAAGESSYQPADEGNGGVTRISLDTLTEDVVYANEQHHHIGYLNLHGGYVYCVSMIGNHSSDGASQYCFRFKPSDGKTEELVYLSGEQSWTIDENGRRKLQIASSSILWRDYD